MQSACQPWIPFGNALPDCKERTYGISRRTEDRCETSTRPRPKQLSKV